MARVTGPREDGGGWCCMCGVHHTEENGLEECRVSHEWMSPSKGLSHLWAYGTHERAMRIWERDAEIRKRLRIA
jgi:hypothetical protein